MRYKKITIELMVIADEAEAVVAGLNAELDRLEQSYAVFGGGVEAVPFESLGAKKRSALEHTLSAGETVAAAVRTARAHVGVALRAVI
jgi:hypothetical protein